MNRVVGVVRIGGVALDARDLKREVDAAAAADLDRLAERGRARRLADEAGIQRFATLAQPIDHAAMRCYAVNTPEGPRMLVMEVFRGGLWAHAAALPRRAPRPDPQAV